MVNLPGSHNEVLSTSRETNFLSDVLV